MSITTRREFLIASAPLLAAPLLLPMLSSTVAAADQPDWRFCQKCFSLFFNGFGDNKGRCAAGGAHTAQGFSFHLPFNIAPTAKAQSDWRFCNKCLGLFWNGVPDKGRCSAGGAHNMYGFDYVVPHDTGASPGNQDNWRYCQKCRAMFWDGAPGKGSCPAGAGHSAQGFMFVLRHDAPTEIRHGANLYTDGWAPIGGGAEITVRKDGTCTFAGHIHNSGAINIRFTLVTLLVTKIGGFAFTLENKRVDGTEVLIGRTRDFDWSQGGYGLPTANNWDHFLQSQFTTQLVASAAIGSGLTSMMNNMARQVYYRIPYVQAFDSMASYPVKRVLSL